MNSQNNAPKVAFVTGYVGLKFMTPIPRCPSKYDAYFITNNRWVYYRLKLTQWIPVYIKNSLSTFFGNSSEEIKETFKNIKRIDKIAKKYFCTKISKPLKLYPQEFLPKAYDFIVWFDNKFNVNTAGTMQTIENWNPNIAMALHRHPFLNNIREEFKESILQERYILDKERYHNYIDSNVSKGLSSEHYNHFQCGYLLYNMNHPDTTRIQKTWHEHINKCGINDQISFNFIAQIFKRVIGEYRYDIQG